LTKGGCDYACCCDSDCSSTILDEWKLNQNFCIDEIEDQNILPLSYCFDRSITSKVEDLQLPLKVYGKNIRGLFCLSSQSDKEVLNTFVSDTFNISDNAMFNETILTNNSNSNYLMFNSQSDSYQ
jgi:hypothetical protein